MGNEIKIEETFKLDYIDRVKDTATDEVIVMMKSTTQDRYYCRRVPPHVYNKFKKEFKKGMTETRLKNFDKKQHNCYSHGLDSDGRERCVICLNIIN